jgi:hypothetical protein
VQCGQQTGSLGHAGGQHHQSRPVAQQLAVEAELVDRVMHSIRVGRLARQQDPATPNGQALLRQPVSEHDVDRPGQLANVITDQQDRPVLSDDSVELTSQPAELRLEFGLDPPGDQHHRQPAVTSVTNRGHRLGRQPTIGKGAVQIESHRPHKTAHHNSPGPVPVPGEEIGESALTARGRHHMTASLGAGPSPS